ncbi:uncharacterized protein LOC128861895 [Anastrepha ludens]|uniref:uncharacterized protein LOC128861895 n=1 Tax=Anastrepha ludens TaxID=28586 RepID=UPI0023B066D1|nr:uncharacterized protein LOC128861895 [Anastrepha ludens]
MSFAASLYRQFDLPLENVADNIQKQEVQEQPSTSQQRTDREQHSPTPKPDEFATQLLPHIPFPPPVKSFHTSCSGHTLFPQPIPHSTKSARPSAANQHSSKREPPQAKQAGPNTLSYNLVQQIIQTVGELENTLLDDQQNDFNLRMAYERQSEKLKSLCQSLDNEKERNVRLMELIRGVDLSTTTDDETLDENALSRCAATERWSRSSKVYESISPLLMQQRYDELCTSYKQCRRQLVKKEKLLKVSRCETETAKARYDNLLDEYCIAQKRFEELCFMYLQLQARKNLEMQRLRNALNTASDCIVNAQQLIDCLDEETITLYMNQNINDLCDGSDNSNKTNETDCITAFKQNLELFVKSLRLCQWIQQNTRRIALHKKNAQQ